MNRPAHYAVIGRLHDANVHLWAGYASLCREVGWVGVFPLAGVGLTLVVVSLLWQVVSLLWSVLVVLDAIIMVTPMLFRPKSKHQPVVVSSGEDHVTVVLKVDGAGWNTRTPSNVVPSAVPEPRPKENRHV